MKTTKLNTVGVRFSNNPGKVFTYRVRKIGKVKLGDELVADTWNGPAIVIVVTIGQQGPAGVLLKFISRRVASL